VKSDSEDVKTSHSTGLLLGGNDTVLISVCRAGDIDTECRLVCYVVFAGVKFNAQRYFEFTLAKHNHYDVFIFVYYRLLYFGLLHTRRMIT